MFFFVLLFPTFNFAEGVGPAQFHFPSGSRYSPFHGPVSGAQWSPRADGPNTLAHCAQLADAEDAMMFTMDDEGCKTTNDVLSTRNLSNNRKKRSAEEAPVYYKSSCPDPSVYNIEGIPEQQQLLLKWSTQNICNSTVNHMVEWGNQMEVVKENMYRINAVNQQLPSIVHVTPVDVNQRALGETATHLMSRLDDIDENMENVPGVTVFVRSSQREECAYPPLIESVQTQTLDNTKLVISWKSNASCEPAPSYLLEWDDGAMEVSGNYFTAPRLPACENSEVRVTPLDSNGQPWGVTKQTTVSASRNEGPRGSYFVSTAELRKIHLQWGFENPCGDTVSGFEISWKNRKEVLASSQGNYVIENLECEEQIEVSVYSLDEGGQQFGEQQTLTAKTGSELPNGKMLDVKTELRSAHVAWFYEDVCKTIKTFKVEYMGNTYTLPATQTSYDIENINCNENFDFKLTPIDKDGNEISRSMTKSATTPKIDAELKLVKVSPAVGSTEMIWKTDDLCDSVASVDVKVEGFARASLPRTASNYSATLPKCQKLPTSLTIYDGDTNAVDSLSFVSDVMGSNANVTGVEVTPDIYTIQVSFTVEEDDCSDYIDHIEVSCGDHIFMLHDTSARTYTITGLESYTAYEVTVTLVDKSASAISSKTASAHTLTSAHVDSVSFEYKFHRLLVEFTVADLDAMEIRGFNVTVKSDPTNGEGAFATAWLTASERSYEFVFSKCSNAEVEIVMEGKVVTTRTATLNTEVYACGTEVDTYEACNSCLHVYSGRSRRSAGADRCQRKDSQFYQFSAGFPGDLAMLRAVLKGKHKLKTLGVNLMHVRDHGWLWLRTGQRQPAAAADWENEMLAGKPGTRNIYGILVTDSGYKLRPVSIGSRVDGFVCMLPYQEVAPSK